MVNELNSLLICGCILENYSARMNELILLKVIFSLPLPFLFFQTHIFLLSLSSSIWLMIFPGSSHSFPLDSIHESICFLYGRYFFFNLSALELHTADEFEMDFFHLSWAECVFSPSCPAYCWFVPYFLYPDYVCFHSINLCKSLHYFPHWR